MKKNLFLVYFFCQLISFNSFAQRPIWLSRIGEGNQTSIPYIANDSKGNVYCAGSFNGPLNSIIGIYNNAGLQDIFIAKYNANGRLLWINTFGANFDEMPTGICVDNLDNVIVTGTCQSSLIFGADTVQGNVFVAKFNSTGASIWAKGFGNNSASGKDVISIGNKLFVTGMFGNSFILGSDTLINYGSTDIFVAHLDSSGNILGGTEVGSSGVDQAYSISKCGTDNIVVSGTSSPGSGFSFGTDIGLPNSYEDFIGRYNYSTGHWISAKAIGSRSISCSCDSENNIYATGYFDSGGNFDTIQFNFPLTSGIFYIAKFDSSLNVFWAKTSINASTNAGVEVESAAHIDLDGNIFVVGDFVGNSIYFGPDTLMILDVGGGTDIFVTKLSNNGDWIYTKQYGGPGGQPVRSFVMNNSGAMVFAGMFLQDIAIYPFSMNVPYNGYGDIFITKLIDTPDSTKRRIEGQVVWDKNINCNVDSSDSFLSYTLVKATPGPYYGLTDLYGNYQVYVDSTQYLVEQIGIGNAWIQSCQLSYNVNFSISDTAIRNKDFYNNNSTVGCAIPWVDIVPFGQLRRCTGTSYLVSYCNKGNYILQNAYVDIHIDNDLTILSSSIPSTNVGAGLYRFNIDSVLPGECGKFDILIKVECTAVVSNVKCVTAKIFPDVSCGASDTAYFQRQLTLNGGCYSADSIYFIIKNTNTASYSQVLYYQIFVNDSLALTHQQTLLQGDSILVYYPSFGNTVRIVVRYLYYEKTGYQLTLNECGTASSALNSTNLPEYDQDLNEESTCNVIVGSLDPNSKIVRPTGILPGHYVSPLQELEFTVNFQNTGNDTAFTVIIYDTLSEYLNIATLQIMSSSHSFTPAILDGNILQWTFNNILLADSNIDEPNSHGFVKFKIEPLDSAPDFSVVQNSAAIVFDYNDPVLTNEVYVTLHDTSMICNLPQTQFSTIISDTLVQFNNLTTNSDNAFWTFGDGQTDSTFSPFHDYSLGVYEGCLIASNQCGIDSTCQTISIIINSSNELNKELFKIYPNPTNAEITIDLGDKYNGSDQYSLRIDNALGSAVYSTIINQTKIKIDLKKMTGAGMYFVRLIDKSGRIVETREVVLSK